MPDINNINVNGTTYNIVDDEAMRLASNPTNNNILVTNADGQAVDSGVNISGIGGGGTTIYDDNTAYDELTFETISSGVDTVKLGIDMDLLWTNSSPTSDFASQTISLDLSDYRFVAIKCDQFKNNSIFTLSIIEVGNASRMSCVGDNGVGRWRLATVTSSSVVFGAGYNASSSSNSYCIPYQIYGIR